MLKKYQNIFKVAFQSHPFPETPEMKQTDAHKKITFQYFRGNKMSQIVIFRSNREIKMLRNLVFRLNREVKKFKHCSRGENFMSRKCLALK